MTSAAITFRLPMDGPVLVQNSPADRVPSHGTDAYGQRYAIDLVPISADGRGPDVGWIAASGTEALTAFVGFGRPVLAPASGTVVIAYDGERDAPPARGLLGRLRFLGAQVRLALDRSAHTAARLAGNHVAIRRGEAVVWVAHLQRGSVRVRVGDEVREGEVIGACGSSGNSSEPHVHLQVTDGDDWQHARGVPIAFTGLTVRRDDGTRVPMAEAVPRNGEIVEAA